MAESAHPKTDTDHTAADHEAGGALALTLSALANVDATALLVDTIANRPAAATADRWFLSTDEPALYHDDGVSWNVLTKSQEAVQDIVGAMAGPGLGYDDPTGTLDTEWWDTDYWVNYVNAYYAESIDTGSISYYGDRVEIRNPGNAAAKSRVILYDPVRAFDPSVSGSIELSLNNVVLDNSSLARIYLEITDNPASAGVAAGDRLYLIIQGDGVIIAGTENDGVNNTTTDATQNNAYVNGLQSGKISWDGAAVTVTVTDGATDVVVTENASYPAGELLAFHTYADDEDGAAARNADYDITGVTIT